jgi:predicted TIM-barrel fold metal-dependent hydrolase
VLFIDSHVHILPPERLGGLMRWILRLVPAHPVPESITAQTILHEMQQEGVTHFFNLVYPLKEDETAALNDFNGRFCSTTPGAIPFASMHQDTADKARVAENALARYPFVGFKFHPFVQGFDPWDKRMDPLYAFLQEAERPVILHTGFEDYYGRAMPVYELEGLLRRYPRLPMVFAHMAFPNLEAVFSLLENYPDLYLDATLVLPYLRPACEPYIASLPGGLRIIDVAIEGLEKHAERIMYGSDHPAGMGGLPEIYQDLRSVPVSEKARQAMRADTAKAFVSRFVPAFDWRVGLDEHKAYEREGAATG